MTTDIFYFIEQQATPLKNYTRFLNLDKYCFQIMTLFKNNLKLLCDDVDDIFSLN